VSRDGRGDARGTPDLNVDFYFGAGSRYSYLASTQLETLEAETGVRFNWLAVDSTRLIAARGHNPFSVQNGAGQYDWAYWRRDAEAWADLYGVRFREPHGRISLDPDLLSMACTAARRLHAAKAYARALFRAVFTDDVVAVGRAECIRRAVEVGLDRCTFTDTLDDLGTQAERERVMCEAAELGAFGVPTFVFNGRLFWGNDRLMLLRHALLRNRQTTTSPTA